MIFWGARSSHPYSHLSMKIFLSHQTFSAISFLPLAANPFMNWSKIAWNATEMLMASAQVIHHRTGRIAKAGAIPNRKDQREFLLMGQEKFDAAAESAQAVTLRMFRMNQEIGSLLFRLMVAGTGRRPCRNALKRAANGIGAQYDSQFD